MKSKNIAVLYPKSQFTDIQLGRLASLGKVTFIESVSSSSLVKCPKDTELLVFSPDMVGGVSKARNRLLQLLDSLPNIKYLVLGSSDYSFLDLDYCRRRNIIVSHVPFYDAESKAEHTIALLLDSARRIIINDRRVYRRRYYPELGHNFRGRILGVIGIDHVGGRVVELAKALGAAVYIYDEKTMHIEGTQRKTLGALFGGADMITFHLPDSEENRKLLNQERIKWLKKGVVIVNLSSRNLIDERAMNQALITRQVDTYCFESESMGKSPLKGNEFALMFKQFSTYTKETIEENTEAMVRNIGGIVKGTQFNRLDF
ncbi:hypothetical protein A2867_01985 [Candidatus Daviesbacteria bacterium RIFCSPHIGHO2_01_FULL_40_11]|uniref:D-isomer specific 2-hydroxyacid dehydrogenase NAD-binding domain-containing protein n=1 Tax=Candidatus Daviesbacteria bacterium RIFCSPHIGHO2_01_FULL_40_11 TaxID=1797762 RepID=A0A1F5JLT0_9BACT|nr:MAG: hypothetical protein A2867_01985 [Candidatus Daviesbacteria bacterium RIFCSPHIGHO2_01_FULL_40_11]